METFGKKSFIEKKNKEKKSRQKTGYLLLCIFNSNYHVEIYIQIVVRRNQFVNYRYFLFFSTRRNAEADLKGKYIARVKSLKDSSSKEKVYFIEKDLNYVYISRLTEPLTEE